MCTRYLSICSKGIIIRDFFNFIPGTDDPHSVLCAYPVKDCVMKFTYMELPSGKTNITVLREPGVSACCQGRGIIYAVLSSVEKGNDDDSNVLVLARKPDRFRLN